MVTPTLVRAVPSEVAAPPRVSSLPPPPPAAHKEHKHHSSSSGRGTTHGEGGGSRHASSSQRKRKAPSPPSALTSVFSAVSAVASAAAPMLGTAANMAASAAVSAASAAVKAATTTAPAGHGRAPSGGAKKKARPSPPQDRGGLEAVEEGDELASEEVSTTDDDLNTEVSDDDEDDNGSDLEGFILHDDDSAAEEEAELEPELQPVPDERENPMALVALVADEARAFVGAKPLVASVVGGRPLRDRTRLADRNAQALANTYEARVAAPALAVLNAADDKKDMLSMMRTWKREADPAVVATLIDPDTGAPLEWPSLKPTTAYATVEAWYKKLGALLQVPDSSEDESEEEEAEESDSDVVEDTEEEDESSDESSEEEDESYEDDE